MAQTKTSGPVGTVAWMAPELFERRAKYSKGSDIFAFAVIMWELAARRVPWSDDQVANEATIPIWVRDGDRNDMPQGAPKPFVELIKCCWAQEKTERPTAKAIQERLTLLKDTLPSEGEVEAPAEAEASVPAYNA